MYVCMYEWMDVFLWIMYLIGPQAVNDTDFIDPP